MTEAGEPSGDETARELLREQRVDYVASAAKAVLGAAPFVGSLLTEIAGTVIPNQRIDRISKLAYELDRRISHLEKEFINSQLDDENFTELMEEAMRQAARSVSDDRRGYLASVIATGLTSEEVEYSESKYLLRILGEINDIEVINLRFFLEPTLGADEDFRQQHREVLFPPSPHLGSSETAVDKHALFRSYREHLASLGLLVTRYKVDVKTKEPEFHPQKGTQKIAGYEITPLGRLLLKHIGLAK